MMRVIACVRSGLLGVLSTAAVRFERSKARVRCASTSGPCGAGPHPAELLLTPAALRRTVALSQRQRVAEPAVRHPWAPPSPSMGAPFPTWQPRFHVPLHPLSRFQPLSYAAQLADSDNTEGRACHVCGPPPLSPSRAPPADAIPRAAPRGAGWARPAPRAAAMARQARRGAHRCVRRARSAMRAPAARCPARAVVSSPRARERRAASRARAQPGQLPPRCGPSDMGPRHGSAPDAGGARSSQTFAAGIAELIAGSPDGLHCETSRTQTRRPKRSGAEGARGTASAGGAPARSAHTAALPRRRFQSAGSARLGSGAAAPGPRCDSVVAAG
jgi:hypothetical protein